MDEIIIETEISLINSIESEVITPNLETEFTSVIPSNDNVTDEVISPNVQEETTALAPDAIFSDSASSTPSQEVESDENIEVQSSDTVPENQEQTNNTIDDLYTLLKNGDLSVKVQSESEADQVQSESESEIGISDIISQLEQNRISESESLYLINENIVKAHENEKILSVFEVTILSAILGGLVAVGFLKGLR